MTQMFKVQSVRSGPQLTFVPSTWQSSLCCQADLDWKTQGGESDMSQTLSAMAMMSYPGIVTIFLPLLKYLNSCCFNKLSFAPSFGKSFLPGWLPYTLHSPWARHLLSTTVGLCERIMTSKVRTAKGSDHRPAKVVEPPWKNRLVPKVKVIKTTIIEREREIHLIMCFDWLKLMKHL